MPAKAKSTESKQGLVISLVVFVLTTIILAVTTYLGFSGQAQLEERAKKAEADAKSKGDDRDAQKLQKAMYKIAIGVEEKDDVDAVGGRKPTQQRDFDNAAKSLKLNWSPDQLRPATTYLATINNLNNQVNQLQLKLDKIQAADKQAIEQLNQLLKANVEEKNTLQAELDKAKKQTNVVAANQSTEFERQLKDLAELRDQKATLEKQIQAYKEEAEKKIDKLTKDNKDQQITIEKLTTAASKRPLLDYERPKGKILRLDRFGRFAYINLGSEDRVKPQLTFSVFGAGQYKADRDPKASVQVVDVREPHLSLAKITDVHDPGRDPVLAGDLLYNPGWSPNLKEHVAIAGLVDLVGDGRDNTAEFMRSLEKQNVAVDAWLDLKDVTIKGQGMSRQTNYLIVGEAPRFEGSAPLQPGAASERKREIVAKMSDMQNEANRLGITVVPVRRFMALVGYRVPPAAPADYGSVVPGSVSSTEETKETPKEGEAKEKPEKAPAKEGAREQPKIKGDKPPAKEQPDKGKEK